MTLNDYQTAAMTTAVYPAGSALAYPVLGLAEESGEVAGKYAKFLRDGGNWEQLRAAIRKELGDVLWMAAAVASGFELTLEDVAAANLDKLKDRKDRDALRGAGDDR